MHPIDSAGPAPQTPYSRGRKKRRKCEKVEIKEGKGKEERRGR